MKQTPQRNIVRDMIKRNRSLYERMEDIEMTLRKGLAEYRDVKGKLRDSIHFVEQMFDDKGEIRFCPHGLERLDLPGASPDGNRNLALRCVEPQCDRAILGGGMEKEK